MPSTIWGMTVHVEGLRWHDPDHAYARCPVVEAPSRSECYGVVAPSRSWGRGSRNAAHPLADHPPWFLGVLACLAVVGCGIETKTLFELSVGDISDLHSEIAAAAQVVQLSGGRDVEHVVPPHLEIELGEWVQFVSLDRRVHTVSFV